MSSNLKVNSLVPATGTAIGIGTTGGTIDFRCPATFGGNVTIGGTLTYDEVINIDSIGIVTARSGLKVTGGQLDVGSNIKAGNAGVVTATTFSGSGASLTSIPAGQLTGTVADARISTLTASKLSGALPAISGASLTNLPAQATIANNADNRVITGGSGVNLNGEAALTFDGQTLTISAPTNDTPLIVDTGSSNGAHLRFQKDGANKHFIGSGGGFALGDVDDLSLRTVDNIIFGVGTSEKVRIDSSGRVLIGGTSNSASSHADELQVINTSAEGGISIINGTSSMGHIYFGDTAAAAQGRIDYSHGGDYMRFYTANTERLRIDSNGRILVSDSNAVTGGFGTHNWQPKTQILETQGAAIVRIQNSDAWGGALHLASANGTYSSPSATASGDIAGGVYFHAYDGSNFQNYVAGIEAIVADTVASNDTPGYLKFSTTADGTNTLTERLRITSDGFVGINEDDPQTKLAIRGTITSGRNLAREVGTIINISANYNGSRVGGNVINGNKNYEAGSDWLTPSNQRVNANLTIDLGAQYNCDRFVIYNQNEYQDSNREVKNFTLEGSNDNSSWTTILDDNCGVSGAHEPNPGFSFRMPASYYDDNEGVSYRYWRFTMKSFHGSGNGGHGGIMELELYEHTTTIHCTSEICTSSVVAGDMSAETLQGIKRLYASKGMNFYTAGLTDTWEITEHGIVPSGSYENKSTIRHKRGVMAVSSSYNTGDLYVRIDNLYNLPGNAWWVCGVFILSNEIRGTQAGSHHYVTSLQLMGLSVWNSVSTQNIVGSMSCSVAASGSNYVELFINVDDSSRGPCTVIATGPFDPPSISFA